MARAYRRLEIAFREAIARSSPHSSQVQEKRSGARRIAALAADFGQVGGEPRKLRVDGECALEVLAGFRRLSCFSSDFAS